LDKFKVTFGQPPKDEPHPKTRSPNVPDPEAEKKKNPTLKGRAQNAPRTSVLDPKIIDEARVLLNLPTDRKTDEEWLGMSKEEKRVYLKSRALPHWVTDGLLNFGRPFLNDVSKGNVNAKGYTSYKTSKKTLVPPEARKTYAALQKEWAEIKGRFTKVPLVTNGPTAKSRKYFNAWKRVNERWKALQKQFKGLHTFLPTPGRLGKGEAPSPSTYKKQAADKPVQTNAPAQPPRPVPQPAAPGPQPPVPPQMGEFVGVFQSVIGMMSSLADVFAKLK
jgi:hypothetical protein